MCVEVWEGIKAESTSSCPDRLDAERESKGGRERWKTEKKTVWEWQANEENCVEKDLQTDREC